MIVIPKKAYQLFRNDFRGGLTHSANHDSTSINHITINY